MFNVSMELTAGDNQIIRALNAGLQEVELVLLNYGFEPVSGDPVLKLHGYKAADPLPVFPIFAHGQAAGDNFDTGQDPIPHDAIMGGFRLGAGRDLAASVTGTGTVRLTVWGYTIFGAGKQKWNDKGDAPEA
jgi:hypothetical protein